MLEQVQLHYWDLNWPAVADAVTHTESLIDPQTEAWISGRVGATFSMALFCMGDSSRATTKARSAHDSALAVRDLGTISACIGLETTILGFSGSWERVSKLIKEAVLENGLDPRLLVIGAKAANETGDFETANKYFRQLREIADRLGSEPTMPRHLAIVSPADAAYISGNFDDLVGIKENATSTHQDPIRTPRLEQAAVYALALVAVMEDNADAAADLIGDVEKFGSMMSPFGHADRFAGLLARTTGNWDEASAYFESAMTFLDKAGYAAELAWVHHEYADTLIRREATGDHLKASELNSEAIRLAESFGMKPLLERAQALQNDIDFVPAAAASSLAGLSARELEVIRLVVGGKSNGEIAESLVISLSTVKHHMSNIFDKTDSANRTEAAAFANRNGLI